jgi:hypothetical protein
LITKNHQIKTEQQHWQTTIVWVYFIILGVSIVKTGVVVVVD